MPNGEQQTDVQILNNPLYKRFTSFQESIRDLVVALEDTPPTNLYNQATCDDLVRNLRAAITNITSIQRQMRGEYSER